MKEFIQSLQIIFQKLKDAFAYIHNIQDEKDNKKTYRQKWKVNRDTRLPSQVIDNKPRYSVRKIIR